MPGRPVKWNLIKRVIARKRPGEYEQCDVSPDHTHGGHEPLKQRRADQWVIDKDLAKNRHTVDHPSPDYPDQQQRRNQRSIPRREFLQGRVQSLPPVARLEERPTPKKIV